jgi:transposase
MKTTTTIALDIAKNVFQVSVSGWPRRIAEEHRPSHATFLRFFAQRQPATVLLEACDTAHHRARHLRTLAHHPILLPARRVAPYRNASKTDRNDFRAMLEAFPNERSRPVPVRASSSRQSPRGLRRTRGGSPALPNGSGNKSKRCEESFPVLKPMVGYTARPRSW